MHCELTDLCVCVCFLRCPVRLRVGANGSKTMMHYEYAPAAASALRKLLQAVLGARMRLGAV
eukprot:15443802-Alexandrium_andersonii.AAC.1